MNTHQKIYTILISANILLWSAFGVLLYDFVNLSTSGALVPTWLYLWIGITAAVSGVFSYATTLIFQKMGV
jgi:hypothetical protein